MKILLTGASGQLGKVVSSVFGRKHDVVGLTHADLDVVSLPDVDTIFRMIKPDWVVHAAAYTDVDGAERDKETAMHVNGLGTRNVADVADHVGAKVFYFSTDYVFPGNSDTPYREDAVPQPVNHYGLTKLQGEQWVQSICSRYLIVRTSWLFGEGESNFVNKISEQARNVGRVYVVEDQRGSPTYMCDLAEMSLKLIEHDSVGLYHVTNSGTATWFDLAREVVSLLEIDCQVQPIASENAGRSAMRPSYSVLDNHLLQLEQFPEMRSWEEALKSFLRQLNVG